MMKEATPSVSISLGDEEKKKMQGGMNMTGFFHSTVRPHAGDGWKTPE